MEQIEAKQKLEHKKLNKEDDDDDKENDEDINFNEDD